MIEREERMRVERSLDIVGVGDSYGVLREGIGVSMLDEILSRVSSVEEFRLELLEVMERREESLRYMHASLDARVLLEGIEKQKSYGSVRSMKFVVYPNGSGLGIYIGDDVLDLCDKFGWRCRELCM